MAVLQPLSPDQLYTRTDLARLTFEDTSQLPPLDRTVGQDRATQAIQFGMGMRRAGFNIFALGSQGTGKHVLIADFLEQQAGQEAIPADWCYVYNFDDPYRPLSLEFPAGGGTGFAQAMSELVEELQSAIPAAFETDEYRIRLQTLESTMRDRQETVFEQLQQEARSRGLNLLRTPAGLVFAPLNQSGAVMDPEEYQQLPPQAQAKIQAEIEAMQDTLQDLLQQMPEWERSFRRELKDLAQEVTRHAVDPLFSELISRYKDLPAVVAYINAARQDVLHMVHLFAPQPAGEESEPASANESDPFGAASGPRKNGRLLRYQVNVLVDNSHLSGAPVIYEDSPAYNNLVGRVEYITRMGGMQTDFTLIKPGALHRANGGYLLLDAHKLLLQPFAWEGLKRALQARTIRIETPGQMMSQVTAVTLEPAAIPLNVKVALVGDHMLYYLLSGNDPEFDELFKVVADFEDEMPRTPESETVYAQLVAALTKDAGLHPVDGPAVARIMEESARMADDAHRLSMQVDAISDLLQEADYWASQDGATRIGLPHIEQAVEAQRYRSGRIPEQIQSRILEETIRIDTEGDVVGQVNGLAVLGLGKIRFGKPSRITARVRMGRGEVVDIEREVALSGSLHSKGVLILSSYLSSRYATEYPLSLHANLVFEQSYGGVDGDSASSTELYALLSALAQAPIHQGLAVTGSVDQFGNVQAIGGVNEKIESFFEICQKRGLTGRQGVLIPHTNVRNLMLRRPVVDAVAAGQFAIYPIQTIDQGIEALTGVPAGVADGDGIYPEGSINRRVQDRLRGFARRWLEVHRYAPSLGQAGQEAGS